MPYYKVDYKETAKGESKTAYVHKPLTDTHAWWINDDNSETYIKNELFRLEGFNLIYDIQPIRECPDDVDVIHI